jgi:hypothetical protein
MTTAEIMAEMSSRPSLASSTSSRIETAAKHMQQCRISYSHMYNFLNGDDELLRKRKDLFCLHKDEVAVGVGDALLKNSPSFSRSAYPLVVSTPSRQLNDLTFKCYNFYNAHALNEYVGRLCLLAIEKVLARKEASGATDMLDEVAHTRKSFVDMRAVGVATTQGFAHHNSGDTMSTVMIMGLHTIMNGAYPMETGDHVMWYWDFESPVLDMRTGQRTWDYAYYMKGNSTLVCARDKFNIYSDAKRIVAFLEEKFWHVADGDKYVLDRTAQTLPMAEKRRRFHDREQVMGDKLIARVKPYVYDKAGTYPDCRRVFGVALSSARPYEMVDIRISRQSL